MAGITETGFIKKTLSEIKAEYEAAYRSAFGNSINLRPPSLMATTIGIASERESLVWDLAEETWNSRAPSTAQGVSLDNDRDLTANDRLGAKASRIESVLLFGTPGTIVDPTAIFSVEGNTLAQFRPVSTAVLGTGVDEVQHLAFSLVPTSGSWTITLGALETDILAFNAGAAVIQAEIRELEGFSDAIVTGTYGAGFDVTFTGDCGKQAQPLIIVTDSLFNGVTAITVTPTETVAGVEQVSVPCEALEVGPVVALTGTLTVIETPVTGLTGVKNVVDAEVGRLVETDAEYRIRSADEIQRSGRATVEAIRTRLKAVADVEEAIVFENITLVTDGNGLPPKSVKAFVDGGLDQDIGNELWLAKGGGIETSGDVLVNVTDSQGLTQLLYFSRPVGKDVYVTINNLEIDVDTFPANGEDAIKAAIVAYGDKLKIGQDVLTYPKLLPAIVDNVAGIIDLEIALGFSASPTLDDNLPIAVNERAKFDTARIVVNFL